MRFEVKLVGETSEPVESRPGMESKVGEFCKALGNLGYPCTAEYEYGEALLTVVDDGVVIEGASFSDLVLAEFQRTEPVVEMGPSPSAKLTREKIEAAVEVIKDVKEAEAPLIERIKALQDAASNAHMSRKELAEALGVSQYAIRKALKDA